MQTEFHLYHSPDFKFVLDTYEYMLSQYQNPDYMYNLSRPPKLAITLKYKNAHLAKTDTLTDNMFEAFGQGALQVSLTAMVALSFEMKRGDDGGSTGAPGMAGVAWHTGA